MIRFDKFFWRNYLQKILMQILEFLKSFEKIKSVEGEEIIDVDRENTENLNTFFSNAAKNLKISEYQEADSLANDISHLRFEAILKYRNYLSIVAIKKLNKGDLISVKLVLRMLLKK